VDGWQLVAKRPSANLPAEKMMEVFRIYMQAGLHDTMFFEAFMISALVLKGVRSGKGHDEKARTLIAYHMARVLLQLRIRIAAEETDNVVLTTVHLLIACTVSSPSGDGVLELIFAQQYMLKDYKALTLHGDAYHAIVYARGGIDNLGWHGYLKDRSLMYELVTYSVRSLHLLTLTGQGSIP
jgi:hypothetical protein